MTSLKDQNAVPYKTLLDRRTMTVRALEFHKKR